MSLRNAVANGMEEKTAYKTTATATTKIRDERKEYHILTFGRTDENVRLSIVISLLSLRELHLRCQMLAVLQPHCTYRPCTRKPVACLTLGVQPRDKLQTYTVVMNFPVCGTIKCAKWLLERHEILVDQLFKKSLGQPAEDINKHIRLFIEQPPPESKTTTLTDDEQSDKTKRKKSLLRKKKRAQNKKRRAGEAQAEEKPSVCATQKLAEEKLSVCATQKLAEENAIVCAAQKQAEENASMRAEDFCLPRHPFVRCQNAERMPLNYRQHRPILHTALARKLHRFFATPSSKWIGAPVWRNIV